MRRIAGTRASFGSSPSTGAAEENASAPGRLGEGIVAVDHETPATVGLPPQHGDVLAPAGVHHFSSRRAGHRVDADVIGEIALVAPLGEIEVDVKVLGALPRPGEELLKK